MSIFLKSVLAVSIREFRRTIDKKSSLVIAFAVPILLSVFFGFVFSKAIITKLPIGIVDNDRSALSSTVIKFLSASASMDLKEQFANVEQAEFAIKSGKIDAYFFIPKGFGDEVKKSKQVQPQLYINSMNLLKNTSIYKDAATIFKTVSGGVLLKKLRSAGMTEEQAMARINPIVIETKTLYNSNYSYSTYLLPGLSLVTLQMVIMLLAALSVNNEINLGTLNTLLESSHRSISAIMIGKAITHIAIQFVNSMIMLLIIFPLFTVEHFGGIVTLIPFILLFLASSFAAGFLISTITTDEMSATEAALVVNTPAFIFSGLTFPLWSMPVVHETFSKIIPFTHFFSAVLKLYHSGSSVIHCKNEIIALLLFLIPFVAIVPFTLKRIINKSKLVQHV